MQVLPESGGAALLTVAKSARWVPVHDSTAPPERDPQEANRVVELAPFVHRDRKLGVDLEAQPGRCDRREIARIREKGKNVIGGRVEALIALQFVDQRRGSPVAKPDLGAAEQIGDFLGVTQASASNGGAPALESGGGIAPNVYQAVRCVDAPRVHREVGRIGPEAPLFEAVNRMWWRQRGSIAVTEGESLVGSLSEDDLLRAARDAIRERSEEVGAKGAGLLIWEELYVIYMPLLVYKPYHNAHEQLLF